MERRNNIENSRYSILSDECDLVKRQIASCGVCSGQMVQRLANEPKGVDALIDGLNCDAAHVEKAAQDTFRNKSVALAERL